MSKILQLLFGLLMLGMTACTAEEDALLTAPQDNLLQVPMLSRAALAPSATIVGLDASEKWKFSWNLTDPQPEVEDNYWTSSEASPSLTGVSTLACLVPAMDVSSHTVKVRPDADDVLQWGKVSVADKAGDNRFYINLDYKLATICVQVDKKINDLRARYHTEGTFHVLTGEFTKVSSLSTKLVGSKLQKNGEYYTYSFSVVPQTFQKGDILLTYDRSLDEYRTRIYRFKADQDYVLEAGQTLHIHAYSDDKRWTSSVTDDFVAVSGVTIGGETDFTLNVGQEKQLTATVTPSNASEPEVTWTSSDDAVATVDQNGKVTAVGRGTATITVKTGNGKTDTVTVTVKHPATTAKFNPSVLELKVGETKPVTVTFDTTDQVASWKSDNTAVVTVDQTGKATAVSSGVTTITVTTIDEITFSLQVIVASHLGDWGEGGNGTGTLQPE